MDLGKLMSMWEESKREVEESRNENAEAEISKSHFLNENSDDVNQEMQHLKQRIKQYKYREEDLEDELGELSYKNEQLEFQVEKIGKRLKDAEELLNKKEDIEKEYEEKTYSSDILVQKLRKENEELSKKVDNLLETEVMRNNVEKVSDTNHSYASKVPSNEDIEELVREIEDLRDKNEEKKGTIIKLSEEYEIAMEKLKLKEIDNKNQTTVIFQNNSKSLYEELCMSDQGNIFNKFTCNLCGKSFGNISDLKKHKRIKHEKKDLETTLAMVEKANWEMQVHISKSILKLKEKEEGERHMCYCRSRCRIFHKKHNWSKPKSHELIDRLNDVGMTAQKVANANLLSCKLCDRTFSKMCEVREHTESHHPPIENKTPGIESGNLKDKSEDTANGKIMVGAKPKVYNCELCDNVFNRLCAMKEHLDKMHHSRRDSSERLANLIENKEVETPEYKITLEDTDGKEDLPCTENESYDETKNLCSVCLLSFETPEELIQHESNHKVNTTLPSILKKV